MLWNAFLLALREIRRNLMRSFLTVLGIVIGVAAVIILVTIGGGATAKVTEDISKLGSNLLVIRPGQRHVPGGEHGDSKQFEDKDVDAIKREITSLKGAAPVSSQSTIAVYGNTNWSTSVSGTDNDYLIVKDWGLTQGREFSESELRSGKHVCLVGATVVKQLFSGENPIGKKIRLKKISFDVIGVLTAKGQSGMGMDQDDMVLIPLKTFQRRLAGNQNISRIEVSVQDGIPTDSVQDEIESLLRERRKITPNADDNFSVHNMKEIAETFSSSTKVLTALLGAVAAVSLLVGGIGIMNIMLVSVTERTREIGTRLAIGALAGEVLMQFLVESVVLSSFGGLVGIVLALLATLGLVKLLHVPFVLNIGIIVIAFFFSVAVGVVFGYFPARKAAALNPIDALRHE